MAKSLFRCFYRASSLVKSSPPNHFLFRSVFPTQESVFYTAKHLVLTGPQNPSWVFRNLSHGSVNLVISEGKPKFEMHEVDPPKKDKWKTKKRLKLQRKREKQKRKAANKKDPRRLGIKGKKKKFDNAEERIKYKLEKAKIKEAMLIERLKRYEVPKVQGPVVEPVQLTGEERFYMKKMGQKKSNYVPVGRRGIFGGLILNMHMHWKKHETVKVICNSSKPGQLHEYAQEIARLSGGIPIHVIGDDTIIFYRGKNYVQPEVMSPIDTLSKKRALEKSKYEQSLESVRRFIAIAEKELELYHRHVALYGDPDDRNPISILDSPGKDAMESVAEKELELYHRHVALYGDPDDRNPISILDSPGKDAMESDKPKILGKEKLDFTYFSTSLSEKEADSIDLELYEMDDNSEDESLSTSESDSVGNIMVNSDDEANSSETQPSTNMLGSSKSFVNEYDFERQRLFRE